MTLLPFGVLVFIFHNANHLFCIKKITVSEKQGHSGFLKNHHDKEEGELNWLLQFGGRNIYRHREASPPLTLETGLSLFDRFL